MKLPTRILIMLVPLVTMACPQGSLVEPPQLPNPASVYCEEQGGRMEVVETPAGQQGICVLADGTRCDEWAYFRGECAQADPRVEVQLESLYIDDPVRLGVDVLPARAITLRLSGASDAAMDGELRLDPNACSLGAFGDRDICTLIAFFGVDVEVSRLRLADPSGLRRRIYRVRGEGLPPELRMVVQGQLKEGALERCYLALGTKLVPLYVEDGG